jgi:glycerol-3-phosphate dehydrogenase
MGEANVLDLLVVGGGINGVGIARDAAGRGLSVMLVERDDLASHTSSWSSKLIHGGLRYLEHYEFRLVREALIEREVLLRAAPHIVWPLEFILPHSPEQRPAWMIRLGLLLYDHLGGRELLPRSRRVTVEGTPYGAPLKPWVRTAFSYADCAVDDSRLVALNAIDARERGAVIRTRTACVGAERGAEGWRIRLRDGERGTVEEVACRALVNATGPWVSRLLQHELGLDTRSRVRLVKGSHIVTRRLHDGAHAYILQHEDGRIVFVIPYRDEFSLIGTTDVPYDGDPAAVAITPEETDYLCRVVSRYFRPEIAPEDVVWAYAGMRPLYDDASANPSAVTRDYVFDLDTGPGRAPLLSVFGGKLTTYRKLAEHALEKLQPVMGFAAGPWTATAHLPGGDIPNADFAGFLERFLATHPWLPAAVARRLARNYGTRAARILDGRQCLDHLGAHFGGGLYEAELEYLRREEWARDAEDVIWRRTKLGLRAGPAVAAPIAAWLAARAGAAVTEAVA